MLCSHSKSWCNIKIFKYLHCSNTIYISSVCSKECYTHTHTQAHRQRPKLMIKWSHSITASHRLLQIRGYYYQWNNKRREEKELGAEGGCGPDEHLLLFSSPFYPPPPPSLPPSLFRIVPPDQSRCLCMRVHICARWFHKWSLGFVDSLVIWI